MASTAVRAPSAIWPGCIGMNSSRTWRVNDRPPMTHASSIDQDEVERIRDHEHTEHHQRERHTLGELVDVRVVHVADKCAHHQAADQRKSRERGQVVQPQQPARAAAQSSSAASRRPRTRLREPDRADTSPAPARPAMRTGASADLELDSLSHQAHREQQREQRKRMPFLGARDPRRCADRAGEQQRLGEPEESSREFRVSHVVFAVLSYLTTESGVVLKVRSPCWTETRAPTRPQSSVAPARARAGQLSQRKAHERDGAQGRAEPHHQERTPRRAERDQGAAQRQADRGTRSR